MAAATTRVPAPTVRVDVARHPAARRVADVLRNRSDRPRVFVLDDVENIEVAVASGIELDALYATASAVADGLPVPVRLAGDAPLHVLDDAVARALFGRERLSRVFALARAPRTATLRDLSGVAGDVVVLDGVRLVGNIGAITRTARALGAAGVVAVDSGLRTVLDRRLVRASRGLVLTTAVVLAGRTECAELLRGEGLPAVVLSGDAGEPLSAIRDVPGRVALVLGGERRGISRELGSLAVRRCAIPMAPGVESLNVSVAAGIALHERWAGRGRAGRFDR